jgi:hypothetical protein
MTALQAITTKIGGICTAIGKILLQGPETKLRMPGKGCPPPIAEQWFAMSQHAVRVPI